MLQTVKRSKAAWAGQSVQDLVYKIWRLNTDEHGILTHTVRTMHRMPTRSKSFMGNPVYARNTLTRTQLIYYSYLRRRKSAPGLGVNQIRLAKLYEASPKVGR